MQEEAFHELYQATAQPLWTYLARVSGHHHVADDLLQETYLRFLNSRHTGLDPANARPFLFRTATNLLHDRHRRGDTSHVPELPDLAADPPDLDCSLAVHAALNQLKPRDRELLWLAYVEGFTHAEIAQATGLRPLSIRLLLFRARRRAATLLASPIGVAVHES